MRARTLSAAVALAAAGLSTTSALAHDHGRPAVQSYPGHWGGPFGTWYGGWQPQTVVNVPTAQPAPQWQGGYPGQAYDGQNLDRDSWLRECRRRLGDNGIGGAVIGGVVGGVAGNVIAGQGNRVLGTVAGAAIGAVAGAAIDKGEDRARVQDRCEAMLAGPPAGYGSAGYGPAGYAQMGYAVPMMVMMVPVQMVPAPAAAQARETVVTEEYIETVPARRHQRIAPDKRVRIVPDKRVRN